MAEEPKETKGEMEARLRARLKRTTVQVKTDRFGDNVEGTLTDAGFGQLMDALKLEDLKVTPE